MIGVNHLGVIVTHVEKASKFLVAGLAKNKTASEINPCHRKTVWKTIGFFSGRLFQLTIPQRICIAIEVGIQSGTLAIAITAGLLKNPDLAIPAIVYSLWMYVSAFISVYYGRKKAALAK
jgi:predicted Na+-dependent transporter